MENSHLTDSTVYDSMILVDAAHLDAVAFDLIVNFERMLERQIPPGDLARWIDCIALDGGLRAGDHHTAVCFIHDPENQELQHFQPARFTSDLHGKAFHDNLGEFILTTIPVEPIISREDLLVEIFSQALRTSSIERVMVVADIDGLTEESRNLQTRIKKLCIESLSTNTQRHFPRKEITLFTMQPISGKGFEQELLGYSLMAALGINAAEVQ